MDDKTKPRGRDLTSVGICDGSPDNACCSSSGCGRTGSASGAASFGGFALVTGFHKLADRRGGA